MTNRYTDVATRDSTAQEAAPDSSTKAGGENLHESTVPARHHFLVEGQCRIGHSCGRKSRPLAPSAHMQSCAGERAWLSKGARPRAAPEGRLAQLVEHLVYTERVGSSSLSPPTRPRSATVVALTCADVESAWIAWRLSSHHGVCNHTSHGRGPDFCGRRECAASTSPFTPSAAITRQPCRACRVHSACREKPSSSQPVMPPIISFTLRPRRDSRTAALSAPLQCGPAQ